MKHKDSQFDLVEKAPLVAAVLAALLCLVFQAVDAACGSEAGNAMNADSWKWILQTVGSAIVASIVTSLLTYKMFFKNLLEKHLDGVRNDLKPNNQVLHDEHGSLSSEIRSAQNTVRQDVARVADTAALLRDAQMEEKGRRERLKGQELDAQRVADSIVAQNVLISELRAEIASLKAELAQLRAQQPPDRLAEAARRMVAEAAAQAAREAEPDDEPEL